MSMIWLVDLGGQIIGWGRTEGEAVKNAVSRYSMSVGFSRNDPSKYPDADALLRDVKVYYNESKGE